MKLKDRVTIVTGGSRGIGKAIALAFAKEGAKVVIVSRDKSHCTKATEDINKSGGTAIGIQADVSQEADVARMVKEARDGFQRIDILVNNAAVNLPYRELIDLTLEEWNWVVGVNLTAPFLCCRAVLPGMIAQKSGKIINLASSGGRHGAAGRMPYRPTKAALISFTECLAAEVKQHNIDVNAICSGAVETDMMFEITAGKMPEKIMPPEDIAAVAVFLASDDSRAITGTAIDAFGNSNPLFGVGTAIRKPE